jgi:hypothetical protein
MVYLLEGRYLRGAGRKPESSESVDEEEEWVSARVEARVNGETEVVDPTNFRFA